MSLRTTFLFIVLMLLPTDWVYHDMEPWRQLAEPPQIFKEQEVTCCSNGQAVNSDGWQAMMPELEQDDRLRALLTQRNTNTPGLAHNELDGRYPSSSNQMLESRLLALAARLYGTTTVLVVQAEEEGRDGGFTTRQIRSLENELDRLGINETLVEIRTFPEPSTGE